VKFTKNKNLITISHPVTGLGCLINIDFDTVIKNEFSYNELYNKYLYIFEAYRIKENIKMTVFYDSSKTDNSKFFSYFDTIYYRSLWKKRQCSFWNGLILWDFLTKTDSTKISDTTTITYFIPLREDCIPNLLFTFEVNKKINPRIVPEIESLIMDSIYFYENEETHKMILKRISKDK
jgi:hypothetical protein